MYYETRTHESTITNQPQPASNQLINNQGETITVSSDTYTEVRDMYKQGFYLVVLSDVYGNAHSVIIPNQNM